MINQDLDSDDHEMTKDEEGSDSADDEKVKECAATEAENTGGNNERTTGLAKVAMEKICAIKEIVEQLRQLLSLLLTSIQLIAEVYAVVCDLKK